MLLKDIAKTDTNRQERRKRRQRTNSDVYDVSLLTEWIVMTNYCARDFGHRFQWPETEPEVGLFFGEALSNPT